MLGHFPALSYMLMPVMLYVEHFQLKSGTISTHRRRSIRIRLRKLERQDELLGKLECTSERAAFPSFLSYALRVVSMGFPMKGIRKPPVY